MQRVKIVGVILAALLTTGFGHWPAVGVGKSNTTAAQPVIVVLHAGEDADKVSDEHARASGIRPDFVYRLTFKGYAVVLPETRIQQLKSDPSVKAIYPDRTAPVPKIDKVEEPSQPAQVVSNSVKRVGAMKSRTARIDGKDERVDVDIAILDTGIQSDHPDLNVAGGVDCAPGNGYEDNDGHGTMVGGFAAALDNAIGRVGVAPGARLWAVRITSKGTITDSNLLCGLEWVTANAGVIDVANLSLSGPLLGDDVDCNPPNQNLKLEAVCSAIEAGVVVVASAGNDAVDASTRSPAVFPSVIAVSAIFDSDGQPGGLGPGPASICGLEEIDDTFAFFSNHGLPVDIAAPGVCVVSTYIGSQFAVSSGTSFAAPHVAGGAALYLAKNPNATPAQVCSALIATGEPGPIPEDPDPYPEPILDVSRY